MAASSVHGPAEEDDDPAPTPDPMPAQEWEAWLDHLDEPFDPEEYPDPDGPPPLGEDELTTEELAEIREAVEAEARGAVNGARSGTAGALAAIAALGGRRGPGQPGSTQPFPGESGSPAASFGSGLALDVMPGSPDLALLADAAAGQDDRYPGASDDELIGVLCAWDRLEAHMAARKLAAAAELIRRRPGPDCPLKGPARMPEAWAEFTGDELGFALAEGRGRGEDLLTITQALETKLPGTKAALRDGIITLAKAQIIVSLTALLDPAEARKAEAMVLGRAGRLTPGGLRSAIAHAAKGVAPDKAKKRREEAARDARVQRWAEDSGNAALMGRELPPAEVLAADQRITAWARQLKKAGLDGDMDVLRARAYLDLLLGKDSRPRQDTPGGQDTAGGPDGAGPGGGSGPAGRTAGGPQAGVVPAGFAGRITLTIPLATLLGLADRPGEIPGIGPIDPALARDLAHAAARNPRTTWCVTVTDEHGHAIGHGCARPEPKNRKERAKNGKPGPPDGPDPGFSFTASASTARQEGTGAGGCTPGPAGNQTCSSRWTRSPPKAATTASRPRATTPGPSSGTCPRSGTPPAPARSAGVPPATATSNTTSPMKPVAGVACVMADPSVDMTTGSNSTRDGRSISSPTAPSDGPLHPVGNTSPNQPATPSDLDVLPGQAQPSCQVPGEKS